ncbi:uncharacterized protein CC84DRAFT_1218439 [Paraphaeosphaeria sporulosa]|uniref:Uncharacterized protein n=1 Tax=Paraphaeosphaeria sporulosa TaxID=1460663 RepID=A0A177CE20_9PLEO|nr:uncharacterized protein CC84DRAFT_1218439 [Paraphaeosphaeria sporulosa]OAG05049.1 hypothetical protein CC84DRAFT_1218439 [Paraphaeosphaeria sporulosa]
MTKFRTTKLRSHGSTTIPLFWFIHADKEQRESTESALNKVVDQVGEENPELKKKQVVGVPWLRNYTGSLADVFDTARGFDMGEGHLLGIDTQSLEDGSLLVLHCVNEKEPELGRAARRDAIEVLLKDHLYKYTIAEAFNERPWTRIPFPMQEPEPAVEGDTAEYILPSHIPSDTKLQEDKIMLFSLIQLTDEEIIILRQDMGDTTDEITIYNWPRETPASQAETYNIFQCVKPEDPITRGQTFVMFIDATHLSGPQRAPVVVVACESASEGVNDGTRESSLELMRYKHIYLHAEEAEQVRALWPLIWNPPKCGGVNDVVVNYPLFYGSKHHFNKITPAPVINWNSPVMRYRSSFIAKPGVAICATGALSPEYLVYILCPVAPEELRALQDILVTESGNVLQFLELNILPREARIEQEEDTSDDPSTLSSKRLDPLLEFFDTPAYHAIADPPDTFVFLDNAALDDLLSGTSANPSVPLATIHHYFHGDEMVALEKPAYEFANIQINDGLQSTLANLSTGNMWFWELAGCYSDDMDVAFWPEYRGSMTREMLEIEWEWS